MQQFSFWGMMMYLLSWFGCGGSSYLADPGYTDPGYTESYTESYTDAVEPEYGEEDNTARYQASLALWEESKKAHNNSYQFSMMFSAAEGNFSYTTTIVVTQGVITSRKYEEYTYQADSEGNWKPKPGITWTEDKTKIGTNKEGFKAQTFDDIYAKCPDFINADLEQFYVFFDLGFDGLIATCGTSEIGCEDDCFDGISIASFEWMEG